MFTEEEMLAELATASVVRLTITDAYGQESYKLELRGNGIRKLAAVFTQCLCDDGPLHICRQPGFDPAMHRCLGCQP